MPRLDRDTSDRVADLDVDRPVPTQPVPTKYTEVTEEEKYARRPGGYYDNLKSVWGDDDGE